LLKQVVDKYYSDLPKELLDQKTKSGDTLILNRIAWGKSYLKKGGFIIYPKRGMVQITAKGKESIDKQLKLKDIEGDTNFMDFYSEEKTKGLPNDNSEIKNATPQDLIDKGFAEIESQVKSDLLDKLKTIDPYYFEKVILILLKKMGYGDFIETSKSGDGGIDGIINEDKLGLDKIYIQAKRYGDNKVREKDIRNFIGAMSGDTSKGVFVTTTDFDSGAIKKAHDAHHTIILIDGKKIVDLMHEYNVGIQVKSIYEVKELDEDFFES
jgi:restriction system protein